MEPFIDLHTHSYYSDGSLSPAELVRHAQEVGLSALALSDHDTTAGLPEALAEADRLSFHFIPGVELSVISATETHIVGLAIDPNSPSLQKALAVAQDFRRERNQTTAAKLAALGFDCPLAEAEALAGHGIVGRGHFAKLMVKKGYAASVPEAFEHYLASGRPAYTGEHPFTDREAIELIHSAGGVAILAHLHLIRLTDEALFSYLKKLKAFGLDGIEGYYTEYSEEMGIRYRGFAEKLALLLSGGSDFHGTIKPHIALGKGFGNLHVPASLLSPLCIRAAYWKGQQQ